MRNGQAGKLCVHGCLGLGRASGVSPSAQRGPCGCGGPAGRPAAGRDASNPRTAPAFAAVLATVSWLVIVGLLLPGSQQLGLAGAIDVVSHRWLWPQVSPAGSA